MENNIYVFNQSGEKIPMEIGEDINTAKFEVIEIEAVEPTGQSLKSRKPLGFYGNLKWNFRRSVYKFLKDLKYVL